MKIKYSVLFIIFVFSCSKLIAQESCFDDVPCTSGQFYIYYYDGDGNYVTGNVDQDYLDKLHEARNDGQLNRQRKLDFDNTNVVGIYNDIVESQ